MRKGYIFLAIGIFSSCILFCVIKTGSSKLELKFPQTVFLQCEGEQSVQIIHHKEIPLAIEKTSVTPTSLTFTIKNNSKAAIEWGYDYSIVQKQSDKEEWVELPYVSKEHPEWWKLLFIQPPGSERSETINWSQIYGELSPGMYCLVKHIQFSPSENSFYLMAPFQIIPAS